MQFKTYFDHQIFFNENQQFAATAAEVGIETTFLSKIKSNLKCKFIFSRKVSV